MQTRTLILNGLHTRIYTWGSPKNQPLFLFHGWLDTGASFDFVCRYLKNEFYCIAPDLRGYGQSGHTKNPLGYFFLEYVADAYALIRHFSPHGKIDLLGHSLGGAVTSVYAGLYPQRVNHFINVEGFGFRDEAVSEAPGRILKWIAQWHTKQFRRHRDLQHFAKRLRQQNPRLPADRALFLAKHLTKRVEGGVMMAADPKHKFIEPHWLPPQYFREFCRRIPPECLLILAEKSEMAHYFGRKKFKREMKRRLDWFPRNSVRTTIRDCGHMVHHEKPEELATVIRKFLKRG